MHSVSFWSFSNHLLNKVLPSIKNNKKIKILSILTSKKKKNIKNINWFNNKKDFLKKNNSDFIYISSINSEHYKNCIYALKRKKNIICEKPICLSVKQLLSLKKIAKKHNSIFFEVIQYVEHPVFVKLKKLLNDKIIGKVLFVESAFKIPLYNKTGFRFNIKLGGGALYDCGFYPISLLFTLFKSNNVKILQSEIKKEKELDILGKVLALNNNGICFNLSWGFKSNYENYIKIIGENGVIKVNLIFSKKIVQGAEILVNKNKKKRVIKIKKSNQINLAFNKYLNANKDFYKNKFNQSVNILRIIERIKKNFNKSKI